MGQQYQPTFTERHYGKMAATGATLLAMSQALRRPETIGNLLDNAQALTANAYEKVGLLKDTALETGKAAGRIVQDTSRGWLSGLSDGVGKIREGFDYYTGRTARRKSMAIAADIKQYEKAQKARMEELIPGLENNFRSLDNDLFLRLFYYLNELDDLSIMKKTYMKKT